MKHLEDEDIARMIDKKISMKEREEFLKHLSECKFCLNVYTETLKFVEEESKKDTIWNWFWEKLTKLAAIAGRFRKTLRSIFKIKILVPVFSTLLIILLLLPFLLPGSNNARWWTNKYGDYTKNGGMNDFRVQRALAVFGQVKNAADKADARLPRLVIINSNGVGKPFALALPDGGIIINLETLEICYGRKKLEEGEYEKNLREGDRRLAFILGHEIAHLVQEDFTHRKAFLGQQEHSDKKAWEEDKKRELLADRNGALYAALAGYDISALFASENNFLRRWVKQAGIGSYYDDDPQHPAMQKRVEFVRSYLLEVVNKVELFRAGVLFLQMGDNHTGAAAFQEFIKVYPAREVFNNIGACYFNAALHLIHQKFSDDYYRFRLSTTIDYSTGAEMLSIKGQGDYLNDRDITGYIKKAETYFRLAAARDKHDRACRCNLAATLILKKKYKEAVEECDRILKKDPQDVKALNNKAIAIYYQGKKKNMDTTGAAIQLLEKAIKIEPQNFEVLYNLAFLKQKSERMAAAKPYWEKYLRLPTVPRDNYYKGVYLKLNGKLPPLPGQAGGPPELPAGIRIGGDFFSIGEKWDQEQILQYRLEIKENVNNERSSILQVIVKDNVRVLALDGNVEIAEEELHPFKEIGKNLEKFGPPQKIVRHTAGNFYVYEDKGFSIKEIDSKAWSYIWFNPTAGEDAKRQGVRL